MASNKVLQHHQQTTCCPISSGCRSTSSGSNLSSSVGHLKATKLIAISSTDTLDT